MYNVDVIVGSDRDHRVVILVWKRSSLVAVVLRICVCVTFHPSSCLASVGQPQRLHLVLSDYNASFTASISGF